MKSLSLYSLFLFLLILCSVEVKSQDKIKFIYEKTSVTSEATVAIEVVDPQISKIKIDGESLKSPSIYSTKDNKTFFAKLPLSDKVGDNKFNFLGFDQNENIIFTTSQAITITRTRRENSDPDPSGGAENSNPGGNNSGGNNSGGKKKGKISFGNNPQESPDVVDDKQYTLSLVPEFSLTDTKAKYYFVENKKGNIVRKTVRYSIETTKEQPNSPQKVVIDLVEGKNTITVFLLDENEKKIEGIQAQTEVICDPCDVKYRNINTRAIVGIEQVGASSANSKTLPFLNLFVNVPVTKSSPGRSPWFSLWTDFRFSGSTVQNFADLTSVSANVLNTIATPKATVNNVVQTFRVTAGFDLKVIGEQTFNSFFIPGKSSLSFIGGGSITSPLVSSQQTTEIYKIPKLSDGSINPDFAALFPGINFEGKTNIAFVIPERDRFYRRWFAGMRLKHSFFQNRELPLDLSPAMLDITFGQDESISRTLKNKVMTFEGFTPFPLKELDYIYLFGGATLRLTRKINSNVPPFFLQNADVINLTNSNDTVIFSADSNPLTISNRDTYRFGIGIDLIKLFNRTREEKKAQ